MKTITNFQRTDFVLFCTAHFLFCCVLIISHVCSGEQTRPWIIKTGAKHRRLERNDNRENISRTEGEQSTDIIYLKVHVQHAPYPTLHECFLRVVERKSSHIIWRQPYLKATVCNRQKDRLGRSKYNQTKDLIMNSTTTFDPGLRNNAGPPRTKTPGKFGSQGCHRKCDYSQSVWWLHLNNNAGNVSAWREITSRDF